MERFDTPEEAYEDGINAFEWSGLFHEIKITHPSEKTIEEI